MEQTGKHWLVSLNVAFLYEVDAVLVGQTVTLTLRPPERRLSRPIEVVQ